jgi:hypothetical protein
MKIVLYFLLFFTSVGKSFADEFGMQQVNQDGIQALQTVQNNVDSQNSLVEAANSSETNPQNAQQQMIATRQMFVQSFAQNKNKHLIVNSSENLALNQYLQDFVSNGYFQKEKLQAGPGLSSVVQIKVGYIMFFSESGKWFVKINDKKYTHMKKTFDNITVQKVLKDRVTILYTPTDYGIRSYIASLKVYPENLKIRPNGDFTIEIKANNCFDLNTMATGKTC